MEVTTYELTTQTCRNLILRDGALLRVGLVSKISRNSRDDLKSIGRGYFGYKCKISICIQLEAPPPPSQSIKEALQRAFFILKNQLVENSSKQGCPMSFVFTGFSFLIK